MSILQKIVDTTFWLKPLALFSIPHPRAFLIVRHALVEENHYLLESIDNQDPGSGISSQSDIQIASQDREQTEQPEKDCEVKIILQEAEKERLLKMHKTHDDQKREWEIEKDCLLKMQYAHEDQKKAWEEEKDRLLKMQKEHDDQKRAWEAEMDRQQQILETKRHLAKIEDLENDLMLSRPVDTQLLKKDEDPQQHQLESELRSAKIEELENDLMLYRSANTRLRKKEEDQENRVHQLETELSSQKSKAQQLQKYYEDQKRAWKAEKDRLPKMQKELETSVHLDILQNDYKSVPILVQTIMTKASKNGGEIHGLAILDKELFIVSKQNSEVDVYDSIKFNFIRQWSLEELIRPEDIGSCNINKCLYILDSKFCSTEIIRFDPNGKLLHKWSTGNDWGRDLFVTGDPNVILTVYNKYKLNEYSPDGQLIREIYLPGIPDTLWYAIKLKNGGFLFSHGSVLDYGRQNVCLVDEDGKLKKSFGGECGSAIGQMLVPVYLSVDGNGFVMVADRSNNRVLLLDSDLEFRREILSKNKHKLRGLSKILLDESNGRLFVIDNKWNPRNMSYRDGQILIFDFK